MEISSLKIAKAQKRSLLLMMLLPFLFLVLVMVFLIVANYQARQVVSWSWLAFYVIPLAFMSLFDLILLYFIRKKTNITTVLSSFKAHELKQIDQQCPQKISLLRTPLIVTDKVLFIINGLSIIAVLTQDIIWLKHRGNLRSIDIVTRQNKTFRITTQFKQDAFNQLLQQLKSRRPALLVTDNNHSDEYKTLAKLQKTDFAALVSRADGKNN